MAKVALITGITGQDGSYLCRFLLQKNYKVIGLVRSYTQTKIKNLLYLGMQNDITFIDCDLSDITQIIKILQQYKPDEIYNLAAQSSVSLSFTQPIGTIQFNILSVANFLEAIKILNAAGSTRFYQASSSEMFGKVMTLPINESTVFHPLSPYAVSKAAAHWLTVNYRESYSLYAACGILFNHESYLRSDNFFTKKIVKEALRIKHGLQDKLFVGNIDIKRDFGYAAKYVEAMWLMLNQSIPEDYLICSGTSVSLRSIIVHVFNRLQLPLERIVIDEKLYRPTDIEDIFGDNTKAKQQLKWEYNMTIYEIIDLMLEEEERNKTYINGLIQHTAL
jgi:GDPmannose 4,6-dehydratase